MSSDITEAYNILNKGLYIQSESRYNPNHDRILDVLGISEKKCCYICGNSAEYTFNEYHLCESCFNSIETCYYNKQSIIHKNEKLIKYDNYWLSNKKCTKISFKRYSVKNPLIMLRMVFMSHYIRGGDKHCDACNRFITWPGGGNKNMYTYDNYISCQICYNKSAVYFDLTPDFYWLLKNIFLEDVAVHMVKCYYEYKIKNSAEWGF